MESSLWVVLSLLLVIVVELVYFSVATDKNTPVSSVDAQGCKRILFDAATIAIAVPFFVGLFRISLNFAGLGGF